MSEYQYVVFQAVDRALNDQELDFAERQSTRADVTRWSLSCEYHYSGFRGDVDGLLRKGYDVFLQYSNYGCREIKLRLPHGLPCAKSVWSQYIDGERLAWKKDSKGSGGILSLQPYYESDDLGEVWEFQKFLEAAIQVRQQLITGDLRGLYLLWVCSIEDHDEVEPPLPLGMAELSDGPSQLLSFYELDPLLLVAAGQGADAAPVEGSQNQPIRRWAESIKSDRAVDLLCELLSGDTADLKANLLAEVRDSQPPATWPTTDMQRTFSELHEQAEVLRSKANKIQARKIEAKAKRDAAKAERERQTRMKQMVKDPQKWLRETERLANARGTDNYKAAADILFDLREATGNDKLVRKHAAHLAKKHPTLSRLKSSLRKRGLLD